MTEPPDLTALATRDKTLFDMGYRPSQRYIEETYNIEVEATTPAPEDKQAADVNLAEADDALSQLEHVLQAIDDNTWQALAAPLIEPVLKKAQTEPEALLQDLASLYPEMHIDSLTEHLTRMLFVADAWARIQAGD